MFDGKAVNCLTNTKSSMVCANCKASPKDFNRLDYILTLKKLLNSKQIQKVQWDAQM